MILLQISCSTFISYLVCQSYLRKLFCFVMPFARFTPKWTVFQNLYDLHFSRSKVWCLGWSLHVITLNCKRIIKKDTKVSNKYTVFQAFWSCTIAFCDKIYEQILLFFFWVRSCFKNPLVQFTKTIWMIHSGIRPIRFLSSVNVDLFLYRLL